MLALAAALVVLGYALGYTGVTQLAAHGKAPGVLENLGVTRAGSTDIGQALGTAAAGARAAQSSTAPDPGTRPTYQAV
jgi:hypothetical protein